MSTSPFNVSILGNPLSENHPTVLLQCMSVMLRNFSRLVICPLCFAACTDLSEDA